MNAAGPFLEALRAEPEGIAVVDADGSPTSRGRLLARAAGLAQILRDSDLLPGDAVVVQIPAGAVFCAATLAVIAAGAVPVLIEPGLGEDVYLSRVRAAGARLALVHPLVARLHKTPWAAAALEKLELQ